MCDSTLSAGCVVQSVVGSAFDKIAQTAGQAAGDLLVQAMSWWVKTPSVNPDSASVRQLQSYTLPIVGLVLTGSILVQAIRMILSRKKDPAVDVTMGLLRYAIVTTLGLTTLGLALQAGDQLASALLNQAMNDFANRMKGLMTAAILTNSFSLLFVAAAGFLLAAIQWLLGFVRQAGILVLAVMLPLAASGSINQSTRSWMSRLVPWLISLVLYKPMAAMIYVIGFGMLGTGQDVSTVMTGLMVLVLACLAMPAMLRFFSWAQVSASGGGAAGALASGAMGAVALSQLTTRGSAVQSANSVERNGPGSVGGSPPQGAGPGGGGVISSPGQGGVSPAGTGGAQPAGATSAATSAPGSAAGGAAAGGPTAVAAAGPAGAAAGAAAQVARGAYQAG